MHIVKQNTELEKALEATEADQDEFKKREETIRENEKEFSPRKLRTEEHLVILAKLQETELKQSTSRCNALDMKFR